jgi:hypothetical protein
MWKIELHAQLVAFMLGMRIQHISLGWTSIVHDLFSSYWKIHDRTS